MKEILKASVWKLDIIIWLIAVLFFVLSAIFMWGVISTSILWAIWIIILMFFVWLSIELILSALQNVKWLWAITGFITNGPEALVLIVWLVGGNVLFAASTPLWSNVMNPVLLLLALIVSWVLSQIKNFKYSVFFSFSFVFTALLAGVFFLIPDNYYFLWVGVALISSIILFRKKFESEEIPQVSTEKTSKFFLPAGILLLLVSWFYLDPIVSYTADASMAPKWLIWFLVLATLTSWPEFKSVLSLLKKWKVLDAFINIFVSNITNIWLASIWILVWLVIEFLK